MEKVLRYARDPPMIRFMNNDNDDDNDNEPPENELPEGEDLNLPADSKKITSEFLRCLKPDPGRYWDKRVPGLYQRVTKNRTGGVGRYWSQRLTVGGRRKEISLGTYPKVTYEEVKDAALKNHLTARSGGDPAAKSFFSKSNSDLIPTFEQLARERYKELLESWKKGTKYRKLWLGRLEMHVFPKIGHVPVTELTAIDFKRVLRPIWQKTPPNARKIKGTMNDVMREAVTLGYRDDLPTASLNMPKQKKESTPRKALDYRDVPEALRKIKSSGRDPVIIAALEMLVLCGVRSNEVTHCTYDDIDLEERVWSIQPDKNKQGRLHRVALSKRCMEIIREMEQHRGRNGTDLVFPGVKQGRPISENTLLKALKALDIDSSCHGFRSCISTFMADRTKETEDVILAIIGHRPLRPVGTLYQRSDYLEKRRPLMEFYSDFCIDASGEQVVLPFVSTRGEE